MWMGRKHVMAVVNMTLIIKLGENVSKQQNDMMLIGIPAPNPEPLTLTLTLNP